MKVLLLLLPIFLMSNQCEKDDDDKSDEYSCTFTIRQVADLSADIDSNFTENNVSYTATVVKENCDQLEEGTTENDTYDSISRSGSTLTISETVDGETEESELQINGSTIPTMSASVDFEGCTLSSSLSGTLDSTNDDIILTINGSISGDSCKDIILSQQGFDLDKTLQSNFLFLK